MWSQILSPSCFELEFRETLLTEQTAFVLSRLHVIVTYDFKILESHILSLDFELECHEQRHGEHGAATSEELGILFDLAVKCNDYIDKIGVGISKMDSLSRTK